MPGRRGTGGDPGAGDASGPEGFCRWCGAPAHPGATGCEGEVGARSLDPPRFCPTCGRRLRVQVTPTGYTANCREHGRLD